MSNIGKEYKKFLEMIRKGKPSYTPTLSEKKMWMNGYLLGTEQALKKQLREGLTDQE
jgi:hypothetical protein